MRRIAFLLVFTTLFCFPVSAAVIHVPSEYSTIQAGINASINGDTVLVAPGTYSVTLDFNGRLISLLSVSGPNATILENHTPGMPAVAFHNGETNSALLKGFTLDGDSTYWGIECVSSSPTIYGNIIRSFQVGIKGTGSGCIIRRNTITLCNHTISPQYGGAIEWDGSVQGIIDSNIIYNNFAHIAGGINLGGCSNISIRWNVFYLNRSWQTGCMNFSNCSHIDIYNNTITNHSYHHDYGTIAASGSNNIKVVNNIISHNNAYGIYSFYDHYQFYCDYNDFYQNSDGNFYNLIAADSNLYDDPLYLDVSENNFNIAVLSPCVNSGDPTTLLDPDGTRADMGALYFDHGYQYYINEFHLVSPQTSSILISRPTQFIWHSTSDIDSGYTVYYKFYLDDDSSFNSPDSSGQLSDTVYTYPGLISRSVRYYWRVKAFNFHAAPIYSNETWNFYEDGYPSMAAIVAPSNGAIANLSTYLAWTLGNDPDLMDTVTYTLQIDADTSFSSPEINISGITRNGSISDEAVAIRLDDLPGSNQLQSGQAYYWRVRSDDRFGLNSDFTNGTNYFIFGNQVNHPPNTPVTGFSPGNGENIGNDTPIITWNAATDPDLDDNSSTLMYRLQLDSDGEFDTTIAYQYQTQRGINQVQVTTPLTDMTHWYYRVQTIDDEGLVSVWSSIQEFWTRPYNQPPNPPESGFFPADDNEIFTALPTISWSSALDPDADDSSQTLHYIVQLNNYVEFDSSIAHIYITPNCITLIHLPDSLTEDTHWFYRIATIDDGGLQSGWSEIQSFWTNYNDRPPNAPASGFYPSNSQNVNTCHPEITWNYSTDPDLPDNYSNISYNLQLNSDSSFADPIAHSYSIAAGQNHYTIADSLDDLLWYYRIRAIDDGGLLSGWSLVQYFYINHVNYQPSPPINGFAPANGEEVISLTPVITWNDATDPDPDDYGDNLSYSMRLSKDSTFHLFVYSDTTGQGVNQIQPSGELDDNSHYFYQVKTIDDGDLSSDWSAMQTFWTNHYNYPPEPFLIYGPADSTRQIVNHITFTWGSTVDYDPISSFTFSLQYSIDSTFNYVRTIPNLVDTSLTIITDSLAVMGQHLYWRVLAIDNDSLIRIGGMLTEETRFLNILLPGDANTSGSVNGIDVVYLVNYFKGYGPAPNPILAGDANGNCQTNGIDVTFLVNYFKGYGRSPIRPDCEPMIMSHEYGNGSGR
jgi:hypothetical protein